VLVAVEVPVDPVVEVPVDPVVEVPVDPLVVEPVAPVLEAGSILDMPSSYKGEQRNPAVVDMVA